MFRLFSLLILFVGFPLLAEEPFTAKVIKNKVRLRSGPEVEAPIVRELSAGELIVIDGDAGAFYQVRPPRDLKLFLFRTFVLDGIVEGSRVNVRLAPDLDAPVVVQLNTGDQVVGAISPLYPKWVEIAPPEQVRFFVAKDFVEKVGDERFLALHEARCDEVKNLLTLGEKQKQALEQPFEAISLEEVLSPFKQIIEAFQEFGHEVAIAQATVREIEQAFLLKKVAYLEEKTASLPVLEAPQEEEVALVSDGSPFAPPPQLIASARAYWMDVEKKYFLSWRAERGGEGDPQTFYRAQADGAEVIKGVVEPYLRPVNQKPGDFVLLDKESRLPVAYLYSTRLNLLDVLGKEVEIKGLRRPNNEFNHPAYFVWEIH